MGAWFEHFLGPRVVQPKKILNMNCGANKITTIARTFRRGGRCKMAEHVVGEPLNTKPLKHQTKIRVICAMFLIIRF